MIISKGALVVMKYEKIGDLYKLLRNTVHVDLQHPL